MGGNTEKPHGEHANPPLATGETKRQPRSTA